MTREEVIRGVCERQDAWDVLVIGGGATGLSVAVDAAARGFQTLLLEQHDFAKATSSRSTKLIHGGFRYLKQGNVHLVRESLHERGLLLRNAPHLVHPLAFVVPAYHWWERAWYGTGLKLYDTLAGGLGIGPSQLLSRDEALRLLPTIEPSGLRGGVRYFDGQFDDARLAIALMRTVFDRGGVALNYARVVRLLKRNDRVSGVIARDEEGGREFEARARVVINATGIFTDELRRLADPQSPPLMTVSQGAHLVLDRDFLPGDCALMVPKTDDGRILFAIPWHGRVLVGTTDVPMPGGPVLEPRPLREEVEFLLEHARRYLSKDPVESDIRSTFAGLRPLAKASSARHTSRAARDHVIEVSPAGLLTITGGKWTTCRRMAEDAVDKAIHVGGLEARPCGTMELRLHGANEEDGRPQAGGGGPGLGVYGADGNAVQSLATERAEWGQRLHARLPYLAAEVVWAARHEMARTVEDVLARRLRALALDAPAAVESAPRVARLLADELQRDAAWQARQVEQFHELARGYLPDAALVEEARR